MHNYVRHQLLLSWYFWISLSHCGCECRIQTTHKSSKINF